MIWNPIDDEGQGVAEVTENTKVEVVGGDVIQLRFRGGERDDGTAEAHLVAESIQGLVEFVAAAAKAGVYGGGPPPEVRVRPVRQGSMTIEGIIEWAAANPEAAVAAVGVAGTGITTAGNLTASAIRSAVRVFRRKIKNFEPLPNGNIKVFWSDDRAEEMTPEQFRLVNKPTMQLRKATAKLQAPLSGDAASLEVRSAPADVPTAQIIETVAPTAVTEVDDYRAAAAIDAEPHEHVEYHEDVEAQLRSIDFEGRRWRVAALGKTRMATITDSEFMSDVLGGLALHHDDIFRVTIKEVTVTQEGKKDKTTWTVTRVRRVREGSADVEGSAAAPAGD